jgi:glycosyltransferase involved in cell wall biosynthesis
VYKHAEVLLELDELFSLLPVILVDDGNDDKDKDLLQNIANKHNACLIRNEINCGKGAAVLRGFREALRLGYTHALQVDADGQHDLAAINTFVAAAHDNPEMLVNSYPVYDEYAPAARQHGRKITNFWVRLETRSSAIIDAMCGFRVYPLQKIAQELPKIRFKRMGFDIEILVKAYWRGVDIINLPVNVRYPAGAHSNYRFIVDNIKISLMHAYLFCLSFIKNKR